MSGVAPARPKQYFPTSSGAPLVDGTVDVYLAGTTTRTNTWQDRALTVLNTNPVVLDARGECDIWLDPTVTYKFVVSDSLGAEIYTEDNVTGGVTTAALASSGGSAGVGFIQAGAGAKSRSSQDKMRDIVDLRDFITGTINEANDYTTELNNAVAQAAGLILRLPPNTIRTQGISAATIPLFAGHGPRLSKLVHINGSATPLIWVTGGDTGVNAYPYDGFRDLAVQAGADTTALIYFDGRIDNQVIFDNLAFQAGSATGDCHGISCRDYLNWNLSRVRWDAISGYALNVRSANVFSNGHLHVDDFTYDNGTSGSGRGKGFLYMDASAFGAAKGVVNLSNGRIEINTFLTSTKPARSLIRVLQNAAAISNAPSQLAVQLDSVEVVAASTAKDMKLASSDIGTIGIRYRNSPVFGINEECDNDAYSGRKAPMFTQNASRYEGFNRDHALDALTKGEGRFLRGMLEATASSDANLTGQGGVVKLGDVVHHTRPINAGGTQQGGRPFAYKVVNNRSGYMMATSGFNLSGTGSITSGTASLVMTSALSNTTVPGMAVDVPGAGAAGATLQAVIRSVDYTTNTVTLDTNASTTVAGATVSIGQAQLMAVDMVTYSAGVPTSGTFALGDVVKNTSFSPTGNPVLEYVCTVAGTPGTFRQVKHAMRAGNTASRPTLTSSDQGVGYFDTTLDPNGKPIWWGGLAWVDATGATV